VTNDVVARGIKAGDLITAIGGRGGGRPNMAQGSLPDAAMMNDAMSRVVKAVEERLQ
jgi:alanyl-tRNA synthetase